MFLCKECSHHETANAWGYVNNMFVGAVPEELTNLSDMEKLVLGKAHLILTVRHAHKHEHHPANARGDFINPTVATGNVISLFQDSATTFSQFPLAPRYVITYRIKALSEIYSNLIILHHMIVWHK